MNISIAQINAVVGDISHNTTSILQAIEKGKAESSDLIVFPEMSLIGYPLNDLLYQKEFLEQQTSAIERIRLATDNIAVCFGFIDYNDDKYHDNTFTRYNALMVIQNQEIVAKRYKTLLPNYDVFHEQRYFKSSNEITPVQIEIKNKKHSIGFEICEDLWDTYYDTKVTEILVDKGAELIINLSASPFEIDKYKQRQHLVKSYTKKLNVPFIYCNMVGGQDELIFDGHSFIYNKNAECTALLKGFEEDFITVDIENQSPVQISEPSEEELLYNALVLGVKDYFSKVGMKQALLGLSGGIDSALVAAIAAEALGSENVLCISMPSKYSSDHSKDDAKELAENFGMIYKVCPIEPLHLAFETQYKEWFPKQKVGLTDENVQARLRGMILMAHSNQEGRMLLTTGNKTEIALGYCTLYGDMNGALAVIGDLSKHRVYALSRYINQRYKKEMIPTNIITKVPSAELRPDQFDPFDYENVSPLVDLIAEHRYSKEKLIEMGYAESLVTDLLNKFYFNEYKRYQSAIVLKVTSKAFGYGRLFPIANRFRG